MFHVPQAMKMEEKGKGDAEQGLQQLSRSMWVTSWEQPAPDKVVRDDYSSCRKGKIRIFRGPKSSVQQEGDLHVGLSFPGTSFVVLF